MSSTTAVVAAVGTTGSIESRSFFSSFSSGANGGGDGGSINSSSSCRRSMSSSTGGGGAAAAAAALKSSVPSSHVKGGSSGRGGGGGGGGVGGSSLKSRLLDIEGPSGDISLPTKHSRKLPLPICVDFDELKHYTDYILSTPIGELYTYKQQQQQDDSSVGGVGGGEITGAGDAAGTSTSQIDIQNQHSQERTNMWDRHDIYETMELVMYVLRGHSYYIPNSLVHTMNSYDNKDAGGTGTSSTGTTTSSSNRNLSPLLPIEHYRAMKQILNRIEQEGEMYMELRNEMLKRRVDEIEREKQRMKDAQQLKQQELELRRKQEEDEDETTNNRMKGEEEGNNTKPVGREKIIDWSKSLQSVVAEHQQQQKQRNTDVTKTSNNEMEDALKKAIGDDNGSSSSSGDSGNESDSSSSSSDDDEDGDDNDLFTTKNEFGIPFAPPGPTIAMYDLMLDCMSSMMMMTASSSEDDGSKKKVSYYTVRDLEVILEKILIHHEMDGGNFLNTNVYTMPTMQTFNGILRCISNLLLQQASSEEIDEKLRDDCIMLSFGIYNGLSTEIEPYTKRNFGRNSATIRYMLEILQKTYPPCRTRGNMSVTLYDNGIELGIIDTQIQQAMYNIHYNPTTGVTDINGHEFDLYYLPNRVTYPLLDIITTSQDDGEEADDDNSEEADANVETTNTTTPTPTTKNQEQRKILPIHKVPNDYKKYHKIRRHDRDIDLY